MKTNVDQFRNVVYRKLGDLGGVLNPPCEDSAIIDAEMLIGYSFPEALKGMYQWANGMNESEPEECDIFDGFIFLPLEKALGMYSHPEKKQMFADQFRFSGASDVDILNFTNRHDVKNFYCLLMDYDGKDLWIDLEYNDKSPVYIRLRDRIGFSGKAEPLLTVFDNVESMLLSLAVCHENNYFDSGAFSYRENRKSITDLMNVHNPGSSNYWNGWDF